MAGPTKISANQTAESTPFDNENNGFTADTTQAGIEEAAEIVKVSSNDTDSGFLNGKLVAGSGINLTEVDDGNNETLEISAVTAPGSSLFALFGSTANNVNNKFLESELVGTSDDVPGVMPQTDSIKTVSFTNQNLAPTGTIEIRVNTTVGVAALSIPLTTSTKTEIFNVSLVVNQGDELNCFVTGASGIGKPLIKLYN